MSSDWIYYFGYGSLVNRETRPFDEVASLARLKGWRRVWNHRVSHVDNGRRCTSLNIEPVPADHDDTAGIDGLLVKLPREALPQLDDREAGYDRLALPLDHFDLPEEVASETIMVYRSHPRNRLPADPEHPVMQSYVDCIMAGYRREYGIEGLQALLNTTRGWELPVFNDREAPRYPRWVTVEADTLNEFDARLRQHLLDQNIRPA